MSSIESLPMDCLCNILKFLSTSKDYYSMIFCFKGMSKYISVISPSATLHIPFWLKTMPICDQRHVSYVMWSNENKDVQRCSKITCFCDSRLGKMMKKFPNLKKMSIEHFFKEKSAFQDFKLTSLAHEGLKELLITVSLSNLKISECKFPRLEVLKLGSLRVMSAGMGRLKIVNIDWERCFPQISSLQVTRMRLEDSTTKIEHLKRNLRQLSIYDSLMPNDEISGFEKLNTLLISSSFTARMIRKIENLPLLKTLRITYYLKGYVLFPCQVINFPNLEELEISQLNPSGKWRISEKENDGVMMLNNLPKLRNLTMIRCDFPIELFSTPNIRKMEVKKCVSIDILIPADGNELQIIDCGDTQISTNFFKNLIHYRKLRSFSYNFEEMKKFRKDQLLPHVDFNGYPNLRKIGCGSGRVKIGRIHDCPKLRDLELIPRFSTKDRCCVLEGEFPSIQTISLSYVFDMSTVSEILKFLGDRELFILDKFCLAQCRIKDMKFDPCVYSKIRKLQVVNHISSFRRIDTNGDMKSAFEEVDLGSTNNLIIQNHPSLTSLTCEIEENGSRKIEIANCRSLESVTLTLLSSSQKMNDVTNIQGEFIMKNLPSCTELSIPRFSRLQMNNIDTLPSLTFLEVSDLYRIKEENDTTKLEITGSMIPNLETLVLQSSDEVDEEEVQGSPVVVIDKLSSLRRLSYIIVPIPLARVIPFVDCVEGMDTSKVMVEMEIDDEEVIYSLGEYLKNMKEIGLLVI